MDMKTLAVSAREVEDEGRPDGWGPQVSERREKRFAGWG